MKAHPITGFYTCLVLLMSLCAASLLGSGCAGSASALASQTGIIGPKVQSGSETAPFLPNYVGALTEGDYWEKTRITYRIDGGDAPLPLVNLPEAVRRGARLWQAALETRATLVEIDPASGEAPDITVSFVKPHTLGKGTNGDEAVGLTWTRTNLGSRVLRLATIQIDRSRTPAEMTSIACHEFGHALGINGHSPDRSDVMYATTHLPLVLTTQDINTLRAIYESKDAHGSASASPQGGEGKPVS